MKRLMIICAVASILAVGAQVANADIIMSSTDTLLDGATVIDFGSQALGTYGSLTIGDVTFTANENHLRISDSFGSSYNMTGRHLDNGNSVSDGFSSMRIDFAVEATALGFNWGGADESWSLSAYGASNNLLETYSLPITGSGGTFVGVSAAGIDHAVLSTGGTYDWIFVDNFTYNVVPVPGAFLLGMLGLSVAGIKLRKHA